MSINYVTREEWGARKPKTTPIKITMPTGYVYVHHSAGPATQSIRTIQNHHMDVREFNDIAYNFLIDPHNVYIGRGPGIKGGHVLDPENSRCHGICLLGNFEINKPPLSQQLLLTELLYEGEKEGWWQIDVRGHKQSPGADTACPGRNLYPLLPMIEASAINWVDPTVPPPTPPTPIPREDDDMLMVQSKESGAVLLVTGGASLLIVSNAERDAHRAIGIPLLAVSGAQFSKYEAIRADN